MKIIQIIPLLDLAGAETMCENLTNSLIKLGNEVIVISLYDYHSVITDRMDKTFNVICSEHMYSCMLNSVPLYVGDKNIENVDFYTLYFTNEDKSQAENILNLFVNKKPINSDKTTGMYFRKLK